MWLIRQVHKGARDPKLAFLTFGRQLAGEELALPQTGGAVKAFPQLEALRYNRAGKQTGCSTRCAIISNQCVWSGTQHDFGSMAQRDMVHLHGLALPGMSEQRYCSNSNFA
jgi:hypothetical protein